MQTKKVTTIDAYIKPFPKNVQATLQKIRTLIQQVAPEATEAMAYGIPTFKLDGKNLVHFGAYSHHIGFYPSPDGITAFAKELKSYKQVKGSVQFPLDQPIPYDLIQQITIFRIKEIQE